MSKSKAQSALAAKVADMPYPNLLERKEEINARLAVIGLDDGGGSSRRKGSKKRPASAPLTSNQVVPFESKSDTHWDFLMKEMMWLAADFQSERKRQMSLGKKVAAGIKQFHKTKESRRLRGLAEAEVKRRRLAGKIGREVKGWWTKIERIIAYKQRIDADLARRKAMDKQLVHLVKQTERYGESVAYQHVDSSTSEDDLQSSSHRRRGRHRLTIEEALAQANKPERRTKNLFTDYTRINEDLVETELYGESTASDTGSDNTFVVGSDEDLDDETTLLEAEARETMERTSAKHNRSRAQDVDREEAYMADEEELRKLREEKEMDVAEVIERLVQEGKQKEDVGEDIQENANGTLGKSVTFATNLARNSGKKERPTGVNSSKEAGDPGNDADDDADASDVEDFLVDDADGELSDGSGEFKAEQDLVDDETTIDAEERLGREISAEEEIKLLQEENQMSLEELRKLYCTMEDKMEEDEKDSTPCSEEEDGNYQDKTNASFLQMLQTDDSGDADEFMPSIEVDDETTLEAEEKLGRDMSHEQEISLLQTEGEIPIEELRKMYGHIGDSHEDSEQDSLAFSESSNPDVAYTAVTALFASAEGDDNAGEEFKPDEHASIDDETTIDAEEKLGRDMPYEEELAVLNRENEMSVEELRRMYLGEPAPNEARALRDSSLSATTSLFEADDNRDEDEFYPDTQSMDDETTLIEEEKLGREMSPEDEIALLKQESETPIETIHELYQNLENGSGQSSEELRSSKRKRKQDAVGLPAKKHRLLSSGVSEEEEEEEEADGVAALQALELLEEKVRHSRASRPFLLSNWVKLREYQQTGLNWLVSIQTRRLNGILADEMGLGKTLQTISLLSYLAAYKGIWGPHLVIVPTSCIVNWETEFKRFCPAMKVLCYYGSAKRRKELRTGWTKANWHHVIVTSYQLVVQDSFAFKRKKWYYMILDEAQNIKNFQSQRWQTLINFNSQRRLLLTGTPLQNNLMELWSLMHFLMPHVFRSRKEFSYWFSNPMNSMIEGNSSRNDELISRLHGIIRPFVLRRLKKDVEKQMPGKFEHIVKCKMSRRQMFLYEEFMARSSTRQSLRKGGNFMGMMNVLMQLRKVCNHPDLFEPRSVVTPFVTAKISIETASCVFNVRHSRTFLECVSGHLLKPLWCGGCGLPNTAARYNHDVIEERQIRHLETPSESILGSVLDTDIQEPALIEEKNSSLSVLLNSIWKEAKRSREARVSSVARVNRWRCRSPAFPFPSRLVEMLTLGDRPLDRDEVEQLSGARIISTPTQLLAMRRSHQERADSMSSTIKKFVFCVPKAGAHRPSLGSRDVDVQQEAMESSVAPTLLEPMEQLFRPFRDAQARLSSYFPDKKLVQFDAGKLQALAALLRDLKRDGHRALIFTQMSKMLDILEAFLNLNGLTYLRLDGGTGVDRRQRLMDRFNNDTRVFCFILSTRSGGLGINLTGADTVIFYDSDWNPAMDAQAQDRAHRIGQTRDVHIYRLITEQSIEENILTKAQQKRNLDIMVMDEGKFDASQHQLKSGEGTDSSQDLFSKGGLRDILALQVRSDRSNRDEENELSQDEDPVENQESSQSMSKEQMEVAMASLEDEDDVLAMRGAQKEAAEELQEFDETIELKKEESGGNSEDETGEEETGESKSDEDIDERKEQKNSSEDMEKEFAAWQSTVGLDPSAIEASLTSSERYALKFREDIDPFWSIFAVNEYRRKMEATEEEEEIDPEEIERNKAEDERRAIDDGDLLGTRPRPEALPHQKHLYIREKMRLRSNKKRRKLNGENWKRKIDGSTKLPFWYNDDTGEALWDKPMVLVMLEADELARKKQWTALPIKPLVHVMEFLIPFPERTSCSTVCKQWCSAAQDISFVRHVFPVEMSPLDSDNRKLEHNHYRTIAEAVNIALPGDTIELGDGHYWINEPGIVVDFPLKIVGDEHDPSHVVVELSGSVKWSGSSGFVEGVTFRRPRISSTENPGVEILRVEDGGRVDMVHCVLDNGGSEASTAIVRGPGSRGEWKDVKISGSCDGGIVVASEATLELVECIIEKNAGAGLLCKDKSSFTMRECEVGQNGGAGVVLRGGSNGELTRCQFVNNVGRVIEKETGSSCSRCSGNTCISSNCNKQRPFPGLRCIDGTIEASGQRNDDLHLSKEANLLF